MPVQSRHVERLDRDPKRAEPEATLDCRRRAPKEEAIGLDSRHAHGRSRNHPPFPPQAMTESQTRQTIAAAGGSFETFLQWMGGQTVGMNPDGSTDYYEDDVERFIRNGCSPDTRVYD